ncbi:hypothetical protein F2Q68_00010645 [Brassica cretica]|uniref:Uncharacterized protein n=1 Tax=Brassica cretica TaxID=69181 RepID=A0A8S9KQM8_BRACR|nr:hypothetical protein F2Q68_00010645 [Brassica cretica]
MSPILDRIVRTDHGARRRTSQVLIGAGRLAHSAGNSWWSAHLSWEECSGPNQCGRVRAVMDRAGGPSVTGETAKGSYGATVMGKTAPFGYLFEDRKLRKTSREKRETNRRLGDLIRGGSWLFTVEFVCEIKRMDTRQKDKEKEIEKEKETALGDRNPKVKGVAENHRKPADEPSVHMVRSDMESLILGIGQIKELMTVHGFGRTDHDKDPYGLGRFIGF